MPVSPALAENLAAEVVGHYQEAERQLLERISRNLAKGIDGPHWAEDKYAQLLAYQRQTEQLIADLRVKAKTGVDTAITSAYERGGLSAVADMSALGVTPVEHLAGLRAVEAMAAETLGYVNATHPRILRSTMDAYRAAIEAGSKQTFVGSMERVAASEAARTIVAEQGTQVLLGATTRRQATQAALDAFAKRGITGLLSKSGASNSLESYVETAMRTGCGRAAVQGHVDRLVENGLDLVIVSNAPRECPLCRPWEGKVLSIGAVPVEMPPDIDPAFQVATETPTEVPVPRSYTRADRADGAAWLGAQQEEWFQGLSPDLKSVVQKLDENHMRLNRPLRELAQYDPAWLAQQPQWMQDMAADMLSSEDKALMANLDRAFESVPGLSDNLEVIRAANLNKMGQSLDIGGALTDAGWSDTTYWSDWRPPVGNHDTILHITLPKGSRVINDSRNSWGDQGEMTLPRDSHLRILKSEMDENDTRQLYVKYEPDGRFFDEPK